MNPRPLARGSGGIESVDTVKCVAGKGLVGDRYFGNRDGSKGQLTSFEFAVLEDMRKHFKLPGSIFRRNLSFVERTC
jgi:hypothetical protein